MLSPVVVAALERAVRGLQYGSVQLILHDGQIVRIERIERIRLTGSPEASTIVSGRPTTSTEVRHVMSKEE